MGKRSTVLMTLVLLLLAVMLAVGCGGGTTGSTEKDWQSNDTHHWKEGEAQAEHTFGDWQVTKEVGCETDGERTHTCTVCNHTVTEGVDSTGHTYSDKWKTDDEKHWYPATCHPSAKKDEGEHTFVNFECTVCHMAQPETAGLVYELDDPNQPSYYILVSAPQGLKGSVVIPDKYNFREVREIAEGVFDGQSEITEVKLGANVKTIGAYAFRNCENLTSISVGEKITKILNNAFDGCVKLSSVNIPATVTEIGAYAFNGCTALETVTFATGSKLEKIGARAFSDCAKLAEITLPETSYRKGYYTIGGSAFAGTAFADNAANYENGVLYNGKYLLAVDPATVGPVVVKEDTLYIADRAFNGCKEVTLVTIPTGVVKGKNVFDGCDKLLESGTIVIEGDYVFINGTNGYELIAYDGTGTELTLPATVSGGGYAIRAYAFAGKEDIVSVSIPAGVTAIGAHAFDGCAALTTVTMGADVTSIGDYAFNGCLVLADAAIGEGVVTIGKNAYNGCSAVTTLTIPNSVTTIGDHAFAQMSALTTVHFGTGVTTVGADAFNYSRKIEAVYITDLAAWCGIQFASNTAHPFWYYDKDESNKFYVSGTEATELTIPATVEKVGDYAFYNCDGITKLTLLEGTKQIGKYAFRSYKGGITELVCNTTGWKRGSNMGAGGGLDISPLTAEALNSNDAKYYFYIFVKA